MAVDQDSREIGKLSGEAQLQQKGTIYIDGDQSLDALMAIRLLGAVGKPGIHYVPYDTDLITLISLAGGTTDRAMMNDVSIRRRSKNQNQIVKVNLDTLFENADTQPPALVANDTILIPQRNPAVSENLLQTVALISGIASIFLSVVVGITNLKKD
jgi:hypothetical protein